MRKRGSLKWWLIGLAAIAALAIAVAVVIDQFTHDPESKPLDPNPTSSFHIVAMGDSYISGEGAQQYFPGTDEPGSNTCHRAATAYPYLIAGKMGASLTFIACSGARAKDVTGVNAVGERVPGQHPESPPDIYGGRPQLEVLEETPSPDIVLISIGGNDAGFSEVGIDCVLPGMVNCLHLKSLWLHRLDDEVRPALVQTYTAVRSAARGAPVYALTYPDPLGPTYCDELAGLQADEMAFIRDVFLARLNETVESAASAAGVHIIDLTHTLDGYRFCEKPLGETAVNFLTLERTRGAPIDLEQLGALTHGTFHPNPLGHELIEKKVLEGLEDVG